MTSPICLLFLSLSCSWAEQSGVGIKRCAIVAVLEQPRGGNTFMFWIFVNNPVLFGGSLCV